MWPRAEKNSAATAFGRLFPLRVLSYSYSLSNASALHIPGRRLWPPPNPTTPSSPGQSWPGVFFDRAVLPLASVDKGTHACGPDWAAVCRVIVLDIRQDVCVLCLADNAPDQPASPSEFFTEDKRRLARQTRQAGCRPPTRITTPDVVLPREKPCVPLSTDATHTRTYRARRLLRRRRRLLSRRGR